MESILLQITQGVLCESKSGAKLRERELVAILFNTKFVWFYLVNLLIIHQICIFIPK